MLVRKGEQNQEGNKQKTQSEQIISNKENNQSRPLNHNLNKTQFESDDNYCQAISPTQKLVIDESTFFRQQKRRCINCLELQKLLIQTEHDLKLQKKKNAKYSKFIYAKVEKQRQLQKAYCQLAKQMKKKIGLVMNIQGSESISNILLRQNQHISEQLKKVQAELAEKIETIQILNDKICSENGSSPLLRIQCKPQKNALDLVNNFSISAKGKKQNLNIFHQTISIKQVLRKGQKYEYIKQDWPLYEQQTSEQKYINEQKHQKDSLVVQNYIFDKQNNSSNQHKPIDQKQSKQQFNRLSEIQSQFKTVNQIQCESYSSMRSSSAKFINSLQVIDKSNFNEQQSKVAQKEDINLSFYSIHQSNLSISNISGITQKMPAVSVQNYHNSDKQLFDNFIKRPSKVENIQNLFNNQYQQSNCIIQQLDERQNIKELCYKQKFIEIIDNFQYFYRLLNDKLNIFGKRYKLQLSLPQIIKDNSMILKEGEFLNQPKADEAAQSISTYLQMIFKNQKKQYEKMLNDKQLYIADLKNKLEQANKERQTVQKIVENYQVQQSVSAINLLQKQENQIFNNYESQIRKAKKSSQLVQSAQRKINFIKLSKMNDKQIECQVIPSDILYKYQYLEMRNFELLEVLNCIPNCLNDFSAKLKEKFNYSINFQGNLREQVENILKSSLQFTLNMKKMNEKGLLKRSSSICIPAYTKSINSQASLKLIPIQKQSHQLKQTVKQKNDQIRKLSQKITLQNIEKANCDKTIENLKIEIYSLNNQVTALKDPEREVKLQNKQLVFVDATPFKKMTSSGQFMEYDQKKQYNNLFQDKQNQLKDLRQKIAFYELQLKKYQHDHKKKKKLIYINN